MCFMLIGSWEGRKNFRVWIFLNKNLLGQLRVGLKETNYFSFRPEVSYFHLKIVQFGCTPPSLEPLKCNLV